MNQQTQVPPAKALVTFGSLAVGARFKFRGRCYEKLALSLAEDIWRNGNIFIPNTRVLPLSSSGATIQQRSFSYMGPSPPATPAAAKPDAPHP